MELNINTGNKTVTIPPQEFTLENLKEALKDLKISDYKIKIEHNNYCNSGFIYTDNTPTWQHPFYTTDGTPENMCNTTTTIPAK